MNNRKTLKIYALAALATLLVIYACATNKEVPQVQSIDLEMDFLRDALAARPAQDGETLMAASAEDVPLYLLPFQNPPEIRSVNGILDTELDITYAKNKMYNLKDKKNITVNLRSYNGQLVGPTLRINQGDLLRVKLNNNLPPLRDTGECDPFKGHMHSTGDDCDQLDPLQFNTTNLHTHGLHVSPKDSSDNVLLAIEPGCDFQNHIDVPGDHPAGTFWYHAHVHGSTAIQVSSGMGGALLIDGGLDEVPEIAAAEEKVFVLQQVPYLKTGEENGETIYGVEDFEAVFGPGAWQAGVDNYGWRTTVNGQTYPVISMKSGEVQRWRFVHAGVRETLNLQLQNHSFNEIAMDGIALGRIDVKQGLELEPGYRSDVLIKANTVTENDTLFLIDDATDATRSLNLQIEDPKIIAVVVVTSEVDDMPLPPSSSLAQYAPFETITQAEVEPYPVQDVTFNINTSVSPICFEVNGKPFSMDNPPRLLTLGTANEWVLGSDLANHPYHIHVNHFEVFKVVHTNGDSTVYNPPIWKDTYFVKQGEQVHIRSRYKDFDGEFVLHCHILDHEDQGMMELVKIVDPSQVQ